MSMSSLVLLRYARQAFHAPELPAASNGNLSKAPPLSKARLMYCKTSIMLVGLVYESISGCVEETVEDESSGGGLIAFLRLWRPFSYEPLASLEDAPDEATLFF